MKSPILRSRRRARRSGTTSVELAMVLPTFLTLVFGLVQVCHAQMIEYVLKSACRNAARFGSAGAVTTSQVETRLQEILACAINPSTVTMLIKNGDVFESGENLPRTNSDYQSLPDIELATAEPRQLFVVRATVPYNDVAIIRLPFCSGITIAGEALMMRHE